MRNWPKTLRAASFRGVSFYVDEEAIPKSGRRIVTHEYVKAETHDTEDMGRLPREFRVRAYIANDRADSDCRALLAATSAEGAATLVLPFFGGQQVRCTGCGPAWRKERLGYVSLDLEFAEAGSEGAGFPALPIGDRLAQAALDGLGALASVALTVFPLSDAVSAGLDLAVEIGDGAISDALDALPY